MSFGQKLITQLNSSSFLRRFHGHFDVAFLGMSVESFTNSAECAASQLIAYGHCAAVDLKLAELAKFLLQMIK